jgi:O-antigen ligase
MSPASSAPVRHVFVARQSAVTGRDAAGIARGHVSDVSALVRWGFCAFLFSIPLEYPDRRIPLEVHTVTGSLFLLIALAQPRVCFRRPPAAIWLMAPYLWVYVAHTLFTEHVIEAAKLFFNYLLVAMLFWVGSNLMRRETVAREALASFVAGCTVAAVMNVLGIASRIVMSDQAVRRTVFGQNADLLGANMALGLVMLMVLTFGADRRFWRWRVVAAAAVSLILAKSLLLVGSRGAIVGVAVGVVAFTVQTGSIRSFARNLVVAILAAAALTVAISRSQSMLKRYQKTLDTGSMSGREQIYPEAWQMVVERPLLGWGPIDSNHELGSRTAGYTIGQHNADGISANPARETHNLPLEVLTSMGIVGALPLFLCLTVCIAGAWVARSGPRGTAPFTLLMVVLILSMNINWAASKQLWIVLAYAASSSGRRRIGRQLRAA